MDSDETPVDRDQGLAWVRGLRRQQRPEPQTADVASDHLRSVPADPDPAWSPARVEAEMAAASLREHLQVELAERDRRIHQLEAELALTKATLAHIISSAAHALGESSQVPPAGTNGGVEQTSS